MNTAEPGKQENEWNNLIESVESGKTEKDWAGKTGEGPTTPSSGISDFIQETGKVEIGSMHIYGEATLGPGLCWMFALT